MATLVGVLLLCAAVLIWLARRPRDADGDREDAEEIDQELLQAAEDEVRDLDAFLTPEDADEDLPDWGPGAPQG